MLPQHEALYDELKKHGYMLRGGGVDPKELKIKKGGFAPALRYDLKRSLHPLAPEGGNLDFPEA